MVLQPLVHAVAQLEQEELVAEFVQLLLQLVEPPDPPPEKAIGLTDDLESQSLNVFISFNFSSLNKAIYP